MSNRYRKHRKVTPKNGIERKCLKCNQSFIADGKFNRICPECTKVNEWLCHAAIEVHQMGVRG